MAKTFVREITTAFKSVNKEIRFATAVALTKTAVDTRDALIEETKKVFNKPTPLIMRAFFYKMADRKDKNPKALVGIRSKDFSLGIYGEKTKESGVDFTEILQPHIEGGNRYIKKSEWHLRNTGILKNDEYIVPAKGIKLDQYGNVRGPYMVQLLSALKAFDVSGYDANFTETSLERRKKSKSKKVRKDLKWMTNVFAIRSGTTSHLKPGIYLRSGRGKNRKLKPLFIFVKRAQYRKRFKFFETIQKTYYKRFPVQLEQAMAKYVK